MRFYYTCLYVPKQTRRLEAVEFPDRMHFEATLKFWNRKGLNTHGEPVYKYTEDTPQQLNKPPRTYTDHAVGTTGWLQHHAQQLFYTHRDNGNAQATDYLLRIIREFQAEEAKQ